jgi:hypothetical protein
MKKIDLLQIKSDIEQVSNIDDFKFAQTLYINFSKIKDVLLALENAIKPSQKFNTYMNELMMSGEKIICKHCGKETRIPTKELKDKYLEEINKRIVNIIEYKNTLENDDFNVEFEKLPFSYIKSSENLNKLISFNFLNLLSWMIDMEK